MNRLLRDLEHSLTIIVSRILHGTKPIEFVDAMAAQPVERLAEVAHNLHEKAFYAELSLAHRQQRAGDITGAIALIQKVVAGASSSGYTEIHFNGVLQLGELQALHLVRSDYPQSLIAEKRLSNALELCNIAQRKPKYLHLAAQILRRAAELGVAVHRTLGLLMSWKAHTKQGRDPLWVAVLFSQLQESLVAAHKKYKRALRLAQATANSRYRWITSRPIGKIAIPLGILATILDSCGLTDASGEYRKSAFELFKFSAALALENGSMDELFDAVMYARLLESSPDGEVYRWIRSVVDDWPEESEYRRNAEELLRKWIARKNGATFEGDIQTTPRQIHHNLLTSADIDPTVEPWVSLIDLAIRDDDPTRVLIDCQNKAVMRHPFSDPLLDRLGLERANPKIIGCTLHRFTLAGHALDDINKTFTARYCDTCQDKSPHPADWSYFDSISKL